MDTKHDRMISAMKTVAAEFLERESDHKALVTVTDVMVTKRSERVTVLVTVFPENMESVVMESLASKERDMKEFVKTRLKLMRLPVFEFIIDKGEKNRQRIEGVL